MRRWEARLAKLEEFAAWWVREQELRRTRPERIAKWMRILAPQYAPAAVPAAAPHSPSPQSSGEVSAPRAAQPPSGQAPRTEGSWAATPARSPLTPSSAYDADTSPARIGRFRAERETPTRRGRELEAAPPPAPLLSPPPPPPRPLVEFINERAGMSIAIDTRTGQMADSATVMAALAHMPKEPADG